MYFHGTAVRKNLRDIQYVSCCFITPVVAHTSHLFSRHLDLTTVLILSTFIREGFKQNSNVGNIHVVHGCGYHPLGYICSS